MMNHRNILLNSDEDTTFAESAKITEWINNFRRRLTMPINENYFVKSFNELDKPVTNQTVKTDEHRTTAIIDQRCFLPISERADILWEIHGKNDLDTQPAGDGEYHQESSFEQIEIPAVKFTEDYRYGLLVYTESYLADTPIVQLKKEANQLYQEIAEMVNDPPRYRKE